VTRTTLTGNAGAGLRMNVAALFVTECAVTNNGAGGLTVDWYPVRSVVRSLFSGNAGAPGFAAAYGVFAVNNTIVGNRFADAAVLGGSFEFSGNNVTGNDCDVGVHVVSGLGTFTRNLVANPLADYELRYDSVGQVQAAPRCWWGTAVPAQVAGRLLHFAVDSSLGAVVASPFLTAPSLSLSAATASIPDSISGVVSADTTWTVAQSPFTMTRNTLVVNSATLRIDPGVVVVVSPACSLMVDGALVALGTAAQPIKFTAASASAPWAQILVSSLAKPAVFNTSLPGAPYVSGTAFKNVVIEHGGLGGRGEIQFRSLAPLFVLLTLGSAAGTSSQPCCRPWCRFGCHRWRCDTAAARVSHSTTAVP
jgi:hypothetical protein